MGAVDTIEFVSERADVVVEVMTDLAAHGGWLTIDPAIDERFTPPMPSLFGRLVSGRGPAVPRATWVPAKLGGRRPEPVSVGLLHGTGAGAAERLADKEVPIPDRWRVVADHSKRGLVIWVPIDIPDAEVLAWVLAATTKLTRVPLAEAWRASVHRP